ncbi:MAG: hypothetical protein JWO36_3779 [Myxococcales bacterium]|nr:hypothetical protein [Myxococcales bacterium]
MKIISWNILADAYVRRAYYPKSPDAALDPTKRRALLLQRIADLQTDVLCLQEVERSTFDAITHALAPGFAGYWAQKGGGKPDGCATFVARGHAVEEVRELRYSDGSDHVALIVRVGGLFIANTHLKWDPPATPTGARHGLREADELLVALPERLHGSSAVVCGDFNVTPNDELVALFLAAGFRDAYEANDAAATCVTNGRARRIDYLMTSSDLDAQPLSIGALTDEAILPSATEPSDHVPIGVAISR